MSSLPDSTYAVLGLVDKEPASGYDLATVADRSLGYFWPVSRTLVYNELARLRDLGWAEAVEVAQERRPDKRVWSSTGAGRDALAEWLLKPVETASTFRSGVLLKFMNRPGSDGGSQSMKDESHVSTEEVQRRAA